MIARTPSSTLGRLLSLVTIVTLGMTAGPAAADTPEPLPVASIAYEGDLRVGSVLAAELDDAAPPAESVFQWFADEEPLDDADASVLTVDSSLVGAAITVEITLPGGTGAPTVIRSSAIPRVLRSAVPTISGSAVEGQRLTALPGSWSPGSTYAYQWFADGAPLAAAADATLTLDRSHLDRAISVSVRGSLPDHGSVTEVSADSLRVQAKAVPAITGTLLVGSKLTAEPRSWSPGTGLSYRWYADGKAISGATGRTLTLSKALGSKRLQVRVTGQKAGFPSVTQSSATTARVVTAAATPKISGAAAAGRTLTLTRGTWMSGMTVRYRWYANGTAISGATGSKLTVPSNAAGKRITVKASGSRSGYATVTRTSSSTALVQRVGKASLSGSTLATRRLSVKPGTWTTGTRFSYSWSLNGKKISGATKSSITVKSSWKGKRLRATVRGTKSGYSTFTSTTASSAKVSLPSRTAPASAWNCPSWAPIKGNADSGIYHLRHQRFYSRTKPEECFTSESAARKAGYRKSKV